MSALDSALKCMIVACLVIAFPIGLGGCSKGEESSGTASNSAQSAPLDEVFWLAQPPANARGVMETLNLPDAINPVVVRGKVSEFVTGRAQFRLTDLSLESCDQNEGDDCPTPWDYCCIASDELAAATLVVEFRDGDHLAKAQLAGFHEFDHLKTVVVTGELSKDGAGNALLNATAMHVE